MKRKHTIGRLYSWVGKRQEQTTKKSGSITWHVITCLVIFFAIGYLFSNFPKADVTISSDLILQGSNELLEINVKKATENRVIGLMLFCPNGSSINLNLTESFNNRKAYSFINLSSYPPGIYTLCSFEFFSQEPLPKINRTLDNCLDKVDFVVYAMNETLPI